jgi:beta-N-acetylhexosaminidase
VYLNARLQAAELLTLGITVDCAPVLDVPVAGAHDVIGDRAFGSTPDVVSILGAAAIAGFSDGGLVPIIKHMPGHGRAGVDSHKDLPRVDTLKALMSETDFAPFKALNAAPYGMTAHVVYGDIDPNHPATQSATVIQDVIRGEIGFNGCLFSDDLSMEALTGSIGDRAAHALNAGCDIALHCNGKAEEMRQLVSSVPRLEGEALSRAFGPIQAATPLLEPTVDAWLSRLEQLLSTTEAG